MEEALGREKWQDDMGSTMQAAGPLLHAQLEECKFLMDLSLDGQEAFRNESREPSQSRNQPADEAEAPRPLSAASSDEPVRQGFSQQHGASPRYEPSPKAKGRRLPMMSRNLGITQSAPMLPAVDSAHVRSLYASQSSSWRPGGSTTRHTSSSWRSQDMSQCTNYSKVWEPLGATWRQRETLRDGSPVRYNADECTEYVSGCVPNWGKGSTIRKKGALQQRLTWCYYNLRRHMDHPQRQAVGERMSLEDVPSAFRTSLGAGFQFWRDLRPPFNIERCEKVSEDEKHPDGALHRVVYTCGIDYVSERLWKNTSTWDNCVHGVAEMRIPDEFPGSKSMRVISWGNPVLNHSSKNDEKHGIAPIARSIDAKIWSPLADQLHLRPDDPRLAKVREASNRLSLSDPLKTGPMRKLLMSSNPSLPKLAEAERQENLLDVPAVSSLKSTFSKAPHKQREHRIWTQCAGFVRYAG